MTPFLENRRLYTDGTAYSQDVIGNGDYFIDFISGGRTLVVTFMPLGMVVRPRDISNEPAWAGKFLRSRGLSILGVKPTRGDWYRGPALHAYFRSPRITDFFAMFERVIFYGGSMGGYGALAFSASFPGAEVVVYCPQTTMAPWLVGQFDGRWRAQAQAGSWDGDFTDGAECAASASRVTVLYDSMIRPDRLHVQRLPRHNLREVVLPFMGHNTLIWLSRLGLMKEVFDGLLDGTLDFETLPGRMRLRREHARYYLELLSRARSDTLIGHLGPKIEAMSGREPANIVELAQHLCKKGRVAEGEEVLRRLVRSHPNLPQARYRLSLLLHRDKRLTEALGAAESACALAPSNSIYREWRDRLATEAS